MRAHPVCTNDLMELGPHKFVIVGLIGVSAQCGAGSAAAVVGRPHRHCDGQARRPLYRSMQQRRAWSELWRVVAVRSFSGQSYSGILCSFPSGRLEWNDQKAYGAASPGSEFLMVPPADLRSSFTADRTLCRPAGEARLRAWHTGPMTTRSFLPVAPALPVAAAALASTAT